jgi:hypothetical protein
MLARRLFPIGHLERFLSAAACSWSSVGMPSSSSRPQSSRRDGGTPMSQGPVPTQSFVFFFIQLPTMGRNKPCVNALLLHQLDIDGLPHTAALLQRASGRKKYSTNVLPRCASFFLSMVRSLSGQQRRDIMHATDTTTKEATTDHRRHLKVSQQQDKIIANVRTNDSLSSSFEGLSVS